MTLELANRSVTHPMGIAEDVVVRVDGFTFLADFVVVNFKPDPRVPFILGRHFLRTAKALIDLYKEKLTLRVGNDELVFYAEESEKSKNKQFAHAISVIDFSKDEPFGGSTTNHSDALPPSSSPVKTSDNPEEFADELTLLKQVMEEDVENKNSNVSNFDEPVLLNDMPKSKNVKVRVNTDESAVKPEPELKNTIGCNLNPSDGPGKPNSINYEDCEDQMGPQSITTAHLCAIDKDCEDFEGPILAQLQPISAIVHTKTTSKLIGLEKAQ
ncbi:reverse transcriptase domain-containing protein [Tanacetum coccineum]